MPLPGAYLINLACPQLGVAGLKALSEVWGVRYAILGCGESNRPETCWLVPLRLIFLSFAFNKA